MADSQFKISSFGYVAENKKLGDTKILVTPVEDLPMIDGEVKSNLQTKEVSGSNASGISYSVKVDVDNVIEAEWLSLGSTNRKTAPDVRRGERVVIWQYGDSDKFYWTSTGLDDNLRRLETVVYCWNATKDDTAADLTPENSYFAEVSTHKKTITVKTSKKNGEAYAYTLQINATDSAVVIADDDGNYFELDSAERKLTLENSDGTFISADKRDIKFHAVDSLLADASKSIVLKVGGTVMTLTPAGTTLKTPKFTGTK